VPPVFEIFSDRITITSYGGLVEGYSKEDLRTCLSMPRNRELMRVFRDLELVEQLGSGMERIFKYYDESIFKFTPNFMIVTFPFENGFKNKVSFDTLNDTLNINENAILNIISKNKKVTAKEISESTNLSIATVKRYLSDFQEKGIVKRTGSKKTGEWQIIQK